MRRALVILAALILIGAALRQTAAWFASAAIREDLYEAGVAAAADGHWLESFLAFHEVYQEDPVFRDVHARLAEAALMAVEALQPGSDPLDELVLLRWLNAGQNGEALAEALDRSVVVIPAGEFRMGSDAGRPDEGPARWVYLDAYAIDRYEITNVQYQRFLVDTGRRVPRYWTGTDHPHGQADVPVVGIDWDAARAYCNWAGKRLPTEAEWERACRGDDGRVYPWGDTWNAEAANLAFIPRAAVGTYIDATWPLLQVTPVSGQEAALRPVGSYPAGASPYGAMDLVGGATEWVVDIYVADAYQFLPSSNPVNLQPAWAHVVRGSAWLGWQGTEDWSIDHSRCAARNSSHSSDDPRVGFRCARPVP